MLILASCTGKKGISDIAERKDSSYAFFVAGHAYGNPMSFQYGLHPPLKKAISFLNNYPQMSLGVFTGDVVPKPTVAYWDSAYADIKQFNMPVHIAPGNHDKGAFFFETHEKYYSFKKENDLFIILSPDNWNIDKDQKEFLMNTIELESDSVKNIFIFCHELIWWSPQNQFAGVEINFRPHYPGSTNYWEEIHPILDSLSNNVVLFAGDLGATAKITPYMYSKQGNVTFIANGMGNGKSDNIIIVEVGVDSDVRYHLIGINERPYSELIKLEKYKLPEFKRDSF
ncbi:MAG: metallophosphoesterase [Crocinitomicaceae bacterium]|nr:metallophosphoesterase [Crocinitomicaceae bacterium]